MKAKVWIARDLNGELYIYQKKPELEVDHFDTYYGFIQIDEQSHQEITWENSPQEIEI